MRSLSDLPTETITEIQEHIEHLSSHVVLSQVCRRLREFYSGEEDTWRVLCVQCGIGRPNIHKDRGWRVIAAGVVSHGRACAACATQFEVDDEQTARKLVAFMYACLLCFI